MFYNIDIRVMDFIENHITNPLLDYIMPKITTIGDLSICWLIIAVFLLIKPETRRVGIAVTASIVLAYVAGEVVIKNLIERERPFALLPHLELLIKAPASSSFPSGHTMSSFAAAGVIAVLGKKQAVIAIILAALIGFSRLYLTVHFFSDVIAGLLLGIACAFAVVRFCRFKRILPSI